MKLARYDLPRGARRATFERSVPRGASWARFGNDVVVYGEGAAWEGLAAHAARRRLRGGDHIFEVKRERLHVVVQNGRLFQQEHPEVPVLVDRGRFLLVDLAPDRARRLRRARPTCSGVLPLGRNQVVFDVHSRSAARAARKASIEKLVDRVSRASFEADLARLVSLPTRFSTSSDYAGVATQLCAQLAALGYTARLQTIAVNGSASRNVIADKKGGAASARKVVVVTAHLDSINQPEGPAARAPGADDNGSGSAGLLEMARVFRDHRGRHDLRFVLFGGEEEGLFGSKHYVARLSASERSRIRAVVNMDMIGAQNAPTASVLLEGAPLSQRVMDGLREAAATYTRLTVETSLNPFASDHVPFIDRGIPAVLTIEGADNANSRIHSRRDTIDHIQAEFAVEILRMNVAFVAAEVGQMP